MADELRGAVRGAEDFLKLTPLCRGPVQGHQGQFRVADDHAQHVVEIVGHATGQTAHGLHFLRVQQLGFEPAVFFLQAQLLRDVALRGHVVDNGAVRVEYR